MSSLDGATGAPQRRHRDLDAKKIQATYRTQDGAKLLQFVANAKFLIGADTTNISLLNLEGRRLEAAHTDDVYDSIYVADPLRRAFLVHGGFACWRTFERWEGIPVVARRASKDSPPAATDVTWKGVPLTTYIRQLQGDDVKARLDALYAIEHIGPPAQAAVPDVARLLKSSEWLVRAAAAGALAGIGPEAKEAVPALIETSGDPNVDVRIRTIEAVGAIGPAAKAAVAKLNAMRNDKAPEMRARIDGALAKIGQK